MRILLTGATGYLGGWMHRHLARDHEVFCAVRPGSSPDLAGERIDWDLAGELPDGLPRVDAIVHAAQSRHYTAFPDGAADAFAVNCASTARLLDWAAKSGIERFCLISSGSVYEPYDGSLDENAGLTPTSLNGTTKLAAEILTRAYESVMTVSRLRLFFPYGPGQTDRMIPSLIDRIRNGEAVTLAGQDGLVFAPLFAADVANVVGAAVNDGWQGSYNVQGPESVSLRNFAERIGTLIGRPAIFEARGGESQKIVASMERLKCCFPVETMTPVRDGLKQAISGSA